MTLRRTMYTFTFPAFQQQDTHLTKTSTTIGRQCGSALCNSKLMSEILVITKWGEDTY